MWAARALVSRGARAAAQHVHAPPAALALTSQQLLYSALAAPAKELPFPGRDMPTPSMASLTDFSLNFGPQVRRVGGEKQRVRVRFALCL